MWMFSQTLLWRNRLSKNYFFTQTTYTSQWQVTNDRTGQEIYFHSCQFYNLDSWFFCNLPFLFYAIAYYLYYDFVY